MRARLPPAIELMFPPNVLNIIYSFVPHEKEVKPTTSPSLQRELTRIQHLHLKGVSSKYMKGLSDLCLD